MKATLSRLQSWRRDWRRRRNLRLVDDQASALPRNMVLACAATVVLGAAGAAVLWRHAGTLAAQADAGALGTSGAALAVAALQGIAPGLRFEVPDVPGVSLRAMPGARLLIASGMRAGPSVRVDLCRKPLPLQAGYRFSEVAGQSALRHALLVGESSRVPALTVAADGTAMRVRWRARGAAVQWVGDAPGAAMRSLGWLDAHLAVPARRARKARCASSSWRRVARWTGARRRWPTS